MRRTQFLEFLWIVDLLVLAVGWSVFFLDPPSDAPRKVDGIVVLGPAWFGDRDGTAEEIGLRFPGSTLLYSTPGSTCPPATPPGFVRMVCFDPDPRTTRGEARFAATYARQHHWRSLMVVTSGDQLARAQIRFARCWKGELLMVKSPTHVSDRLRENAYEAAAMVKAEVWQRGC